MPEIPQEIYDVIKILSDDALEELKRERELGDLNFGPLVKKLTSIRSMIEQLAREDTDELPPSLIERLPTTIAELRNLVERMQQFNLQRDNPTTERQAIDTTFRGIHDWFATQVRPQLLRGSLLDLQEKATESDRLLEKARQATEETTRVLERLRTSAGETAATQIAPSYSTQANHHRDVAARWLLGALGGLVITALLGITLFIFVPPESVQSTEWPRFVRELVLRVFFVSIAAYFTSFCVRNYRVNKHLQVLNGEKMNALNTYVQFVETAVDEERSMITAELVRAVFRTPDTGFLQEQREKTIVEESGVTGLLSLFRGPRTPPPGG